MVSPGVWREFVQMLTLVSHHTPATLLFLSLLFQCNQNYLSPWDGANKLATTKGLVCPTVRADRSRLGTQMGDITSPRMKTLHSTDRGETSPTRPTKSILWKQRSQEWRKGKRVPLSTFIQDEYSCELGRIILDCRNFVIPKQSSVTIPCKTSTQGQDETTALFEPLDPQHLPDELVIDPSLVTIRQKKG